MISVDLRRSAIAWIRFMSFVEHVGRPIGIGDLDAAHWLIKHIWYGSPSSGGLGSSRSSGNIGVMFLPPQNVDGAGAGAAVAAAGPRSTAPG